MSLFLGPEELVCNYVEGVCLVVVASVYRKAWTGRTGYEGPVSTDPRWTVGSPEGPKCWVPGAFREFAGWRTEEAPKQEGSSGPTQGSVGVRKQSVQDTRVEKDIVLSRAGNEVAEGKV